MKIEEDRLIRNYYYAILFSALQAQDKSFKLAVTHLHIAQMNKTGPIIVIDDDKDDCDIINTVYSNLKYQNKLLTFTKGREALEYLQLGDIQPFIIISDIYMKEISGFELRAMIHSDENLRIKCIPYLFFTSGDATSHLVTTAYSMSIQGFFQKPTTYDEMRDLLVHIIEYWKRGMTPGRFKV